MKNRKLKKKTALKKRVVSKKHPRQGSATQLFSSKNIVVLAVVVLLIMVLILITFEAPKNQEPIIIEQYVCEGTPPKNSTICENDAVNLGKDTPVSLANFCTTETKCQYICNKGYENFDNVCLEKGTVGNDCVGEIPKNASICSGDDTNLGWDSANILVSTCTSYKKCEYVCKNGFIKEGNVCVKIYCKDAKEINLIGSIVAIASESNDFTSGVSPLGGKTNYFLIFDNNVFIEAAKNPYAENWVEEGKRISQWLSEKKVDDVIFSDVDNKLALDIVSEGMNCLKVSGKISTLTGRDGEIDANREYLRNLYTK